MSEVSVPSSVTQVDALAFYDCKALKRATFHGATRFGFDPNQFTGVFTDCEALEEVTLGEGTEQIPDLMFSRCARSDGRGVSDGACGGA